MWPGAVMALFVGLLVLPLLMAGAATAEPRQLPGSRVIIDLPDDFTPADRYLGFSHVSGASVVILEVPGRAFAQMRGAFVANALASRGIIDVKPLDLGPQSGNRLAVTARQGTPAGWFEKVLLLMADDETTALVTVNVPEGAASGGRIEMAAMIAAVRGASLAPKALPSNLPYSITDPAPLRFATTFAGAGLLYNETGALPGGPVEKLGTSFIVVNSMDRRQADDRSVFTMRLLQSIPEMRDVTISRTEEVEIDGFQGLAQHVRAVKVAPTRAEQAMLIYHAVLFDPEGGYYRMVGMAPLARGQAAMADFVRMANSFRLNRRTAN